MTPELRFAELLRIPTVSSYGPEDEDEKVFASFPKKLAKLYPAFHKVLTLEAVGDRGLVYVWEGKNPHLPPVMGMAHWDVVPPGDRDAWEDDPFSGRIEEGRIHGRGALDDKGMLVAWLEAAESLAAGGFQPHRTVYFVFGGDEETTGSRGAARIAQVLAKRGLHFSFVLDEGGAVAVDQMSAFTDKPVALIGTAEKGYLTLRLTTTGLPGHASAPPKETAIGRLGRAVALLESKPFPRRITAAPAGMLQALGRVIPGPKGFLLRHPRFFAFAIKKILGDDRSTAPMVRSTLAPTVFRSGERDNVLPDKAEAMVNIRILPGDSVASVLERVKSLVGDQVTVDTVEGSVFEPVPDSPVGDGPWNKIASLAEQLWDDVVVSPYLMTATTDSRHFRSITDRIYRFIPMEVSGNDMKGVHAPNESLSLDAWRKGISFFKALLENLDYED